MNCRDAQTDIQTDTNLLHFTHTYNVPRKITEITVTLILSTMLIRHTPIFLLLGGPTAATTITTITIIIIIINFSCCVEEGTGVHKVLVGKPEGKRSLRRPRRRWEDNIKMDLQEVRRGCGEWMGLAQDRDRWRALVSTEMNFRVP